MEINPMESKSLADNRFQNRGKNSPPICPKASAAGPPPLSSARDNPKLDPIFCPRAITINPPGTCSS
jgi:hypothetical protein